MNKGVIEKKMALYLTFIYMLPCVFLRTSTHRICVVLRLWYDRHFQILWHVSKYVK
jgi:hypothetical protein